MGTVQVAFLIGLALGLVALAAGVVLLVRMARRRGVTFPGRRPRRRRPVTRIVCGGLASAILVAVAVGTSCEVRRVYATEDGAKAPEVRAPTVPAKPQVSETEEWLGEPLVERSRLLAHVMVGGVEGGQWPVRADRCTDARASVA
ncbi:MAG: hypothetical protein ACYTFI_12345 [Planctomycetota bacterium]|jgi:hypothetical protein